MADERDTLGTCPICRGETERAWRPFCSKRCADVDLGRWVNGAYVVPTEEAPGTATSEE